MPSVAVAYFYHFLVTSCACSDCAINRD